MCSGVDGFLTWGRWVEPSSHRWARAEKKYIFSLVVVEALYLKACEPYVMSTFFGVVKVRRAMYGGFTWHAFVIGDDSGVVVGVYLLVKELLISHHESICVDKYRAGDREGTFRRLLGVLGARGLGLERMRTLSKTSLTPNVCLPLR
jgi:hypothetical protein